MDEGDILQPDTRAGAGTGTGAGNSRRGGRPRPGSRRGRVVTINAGDVPDPPPPTPPKRTRGLKKRQPPKDTAADQAARRLGTNPLPFDATLAFVFRTSGGKLTAINAARLITHKDQRFERLVWAYDQASETDKQAIRLEDLCAAAEISPDEFLAEVIPALWRRNQDIGKIVAAVSHPAVIEATVENAIHGGTFGSRDRQMLHENSGFLPTKGGFSVNIDQSHKTLVAGGKATPEDLGGPGLPPFEQDMVQFSTAVRDTSGYLLPPPSDSQEIIVPYEENVQSDSNQS